MTTHTHTLSLSHGQPKYRTPSADTSRQRHRDYCQKFMYGNLVGSVLYGKPWKWVDLVTYDLDLYLWPCEQVCAVLGGKRGYYQNCSVLYCVLKVVHSHEHTYRWAVLTVLWIGFCLTGPISLCVDSCVYVFFALCCLTAYVLYYCNTVGWTW